MQESLFYKAAGLRPATLLKKTLAQAFSCEFWEISKNTFFTEHLWATASAITKNYYQVRGTKTYKMKEYIEFLYYFSIMPDRYGSVPIFISDRPSVFIGTIFFGMIFVMERGWNAPILKVIRGVSDSYRSAPKS